MVGKLLWYISDRSSYKLKMHMSISETIKNVTFYVKGSINFQKHLQRVTINTPKVFSLVTTHPKCFIYLIPQ